MNVTFACPHCDQPATVEFAADAASIDCPQCHAALGAPEGSWSDHDLRRCLICGSRDLFIRKDFPHRLGVSIVVVGFAMSCVTWYLYWTYLTFTVLCATALADMALFFVVGDCLNCYRCRAEYRQLPTFSEHGPFSLETHERYRQQAARLVRNAPSAARASDDVASVSDVARH